MLSAAASRFSDHAFEVFSLGEKNRSRASPSPCLGPSGRTPNQGPFPPPVLPGFNGTASPSDACRARPLCRAVGGCSRRADKPPVLPVRACVRAVPTTPASQSTFICRCIWSTAAAFVHGEGTRRSHQTFRGLLGLHSRYGPYDC
jgi:hypothetical protein